MSNFEPTKSQQALIASFLADQTKADQTKTDELFDECKNNPQLLDYVSQLVAQDRLLRGELDEENHSTFFVKEVAARVEAKPSIKQASQYQNPAVTSLADKVSQKIRERQNSFNWDSNPWSMAASILVLVGVLMVGVVIDNNASFATVTNVAATSAKDIDLSIGNRLGQGKIELDQGYSELTLNNGVTLVLEAPVSLTLHSENKVTLNSGKLVANVPENAIGFRIDTPSSEIIDLGTEFGVEVSPSGDSQVHVLTGLVKARADNSQTFQHIEKDQALAFSLSNQVDKIANNPKEFMRVLPGKSAEAPSYLHWSFDGAENNRFSSTNNGISNLDYPAYDRSKRQPVSQVTGAFGNGIELNGDGNWLETEYPGIASDNPRTVSFWAKVPSDFSINEAYGIISWGLQENYSSWQISPNPETVNGELGRLRIGTYNAQVVGTTDLRDDQWHHIAVVLYGGESSDISTHVLLYVDGKLEKTVNKSIAKVNTQLDHPKSKSLSIGRNIGFHPNATHVKQNYFKGSVDELYIFEAALSQQQIQKLMKNNRI